MNNGLKLSVSTESWYVRMAGYHHSRLVRYRNSLSGIRPTSPYDGKDRAEGTRSPTSFSTQSMIPIWVSSSPFSPSSSSLCIRVALHSHTCSDDKKFRSFGHVPYRFNVKYRTASTYRWTNVSTLSCIGDDDDNTIVLLGVAVISTSIRLLFSAIGIGVFITSLSAIHRAA